MRTTSLLGLVLFPTLIACGGASETPSDSVALGRQASAVQDGTSDTKTSHNFAVGIASRYGAICSGTLIAPNLVLTARHCVVPPAADEAVTCADKFAANVNPDTLYVTTSPTMMRRGQKMYAAAKITTPADKSFCGNDIALITLEENIPESEARPATPVVQFSMSDRTKIGGEVAAVGYGITAPNANDSGVRRVKEKIEIVCVPGDKSYACKGSYEQMVDSDKEFVTEGYVCSGDSGSGAFDQDSFTKGTPYVLGALSRGPQTDDRCLAAIYSRTDAHADLIVAAAKDAAKSGGYAEPDWVNPQAEAIPEDPTGDGSGCEGDTCTSTDATEPASNPTVRKTTTTGCSATPRTSSESSFGVLALAGVAALVVSRRRRAH